MKTWIKLSSLKIKPIEKIDLESTRWKLDLESWKTQQSVIELLSNPKTEVFIIDKKIWAVQITDWKNTLVASNDPEAPWILNLNYAVSLTSTKLTKHIWNILNSIH